MGNMTGKNVLIIMGAGYIGKRVYEEVALFMDEDYEEVYFFDNDLNKQGTIYNECLVLGKKELLDLCQRCACSIIIATDKWKELYSMCCRMNIEKDVIMVCDKLFFAGNQYQLTRYSQEGEEIYLSDVFREKEDGFYVDVGAHHPFRFSNTYWAYKRGWRGINIEPNEDFFALFEKNRKRDININCGVSSKCGVLTYYKFEEPAYNTFVKVEFEGIREPKEIKEVSVRRLDEILAEYNVNEIDFLNVDVEGFEMEVLKSNNWDKYMPKYILLEQRVGSLEELMDTEEYRFLLQQGYKCEWKSTRTVAYKKEIEL